MNVYKYRFDLGDSVSRLTPWPTPSLLHELPLAQEEEPRKQGEERSRTPSPEPSLGPGRIRQRAWDTLSLLKGLESGGASACSRPQWASWTDPFLWPPPQLLSPPLLAPCRPPLLFRHLPAHSPVPPSLTCSDWTARCGCASAAMDCALCLPSSHFPLSHSPLLLAPPSVLVDTDFSQFPCFLLSLPTRPGGSTPSSSPTHVSPTRPVSFSSLLAFPSSPFSLASLSVVLSPVRSPFRHST